MTRAFARWTPMVLALAWSVVASVPARATAVFIDESIEGISPTVTSDSPLFVGATVTPQATPETWLIDVTMQGTYPLVFGTPLGLELSEPGTGELSDSFGVNGVTGLPTTAVFEYALFSDDENGNLAGRYSSCPGACSQAVEDGTFQLAIAGEATSAGSFDVRLKSDLDPISVPEPSSLALLAAAVAGLGLICRPRWHVSTAAEPGSLTLKQR